MAHQGDSGQGLRLRFFIAAHPQLFMVLPLRERQLQRGLQPLLDARLRRNGQDLRGPQRTRRIAFRQMVAASSLAQAALAQAGLGHQLARQL